ncbi:MAG: hypothetical protein E7172_03105 [Firmicutes bacterium]|nr:hypothetical protein [Bacillota bacterium]
MISSKEYKELLTKLRKDKLINLVKHLEKLYLLKENKPLEFSSAKKNELIEFLNDMHYLYLQLIIQTLDYEDYLCLKKIIRKKSILGVNKELEKFLNDVKILFNDEMSFETYKFIQKILKNSKIKKTIIKNDEIYKIIDGYIIAYGVVSLEKINNFNANLMDIYYKKDYLIFEKEIVSKKLQNKNKIKKYLNDKKYKDFSEKQYLMLGKNIYHHQMKSFKKLISILKRNYVFKNHDIEFIDENIIIPYLYNPLKDEKNAYKKLEESINYYFEFNNDKLKKVMLENIKKIKDEFPVWEFRGFSKNEREI